MATCHSLRVVDDDFLGDPLDVKMFEFTGWSFQELAQKTNLVDEEDGRNSPSSIARPPAGMEYGIDGSYDCSEVGAYKCYSLKRSALKRLAECANRARKPKIL